MSFPIPKYKSAEALSKQAERAKARFTRPEVLSRLQDSSEEMKRKALLTKKKAEWITVLHSIRKSRYLPNNVYLCILF